jgi:adenosylmethionine-8-amino-7-oxononanoate aminotransferase
VLACTVALKVQRIVKADGLVKRCREQGAYLGRCLHVSVAPLPLVGNVRGPGLFWGVELVADKHSRRLLACAVGAAALHRLCLDWGIAVYLGSGCAD